jgi:CheY-like chemotaxis protein
MKNEKKYLLFLVENQQSYAFMLKYKLLKRTQYQMLCFKTSEECLENIYLNPDLILIDSQLPGKSLADLLKFLLKQAPKIPVLILATAEEMEDSEELRAIHVRYNKRTILDYVENEDNTTMLADRVVTRVSKIFEKQRIRKLKSRRRLLLLSLLLISVAIGALLLIQ